MRSVFVKWEKEERKTEICKGKIRKIKGKSERRGDEEWLMDIKDAAGLIIVRVPPMPTEAHSAARQM